MSKKVKINLKKNPTKTITYRKYIKIILSLPEESKSKSVKVNQKTLFQETVEKSSRKYNLPTRSLYGLEID